MNAEDRKLAIVEAALPLFACKGFAETTTKDLARAAGVSEPLLYRHFPSKEALYGEIQSFTCRWDDPLARKLADLLPSTETLVRSIYCLMRVLILGRTSDGPMRNLRHRLMLNSLLEDGAYARLLYQSRFECFCVRIDACLEAAEKAGEAVPGPVSAGNRARFAHHLAAWVAWAHLPDPPVIDYHASRDELLHQTVWFALRGMGLTDEAISRYYEPESLARFFEED